MKNLAYPSRNDPKNELPDRRRPTAGSRQPTADRRGNLSEKSVPRKSQKVVRVIK